MINKKKQIIIVGGVAAGASAAARLRRLDEHAEIHLIERGGFVSFANCGLPYYLGGEIADRGKLLVQTPKRLSELLNISVHLNAEVMAIDRARKEIVVTLKTENSTVRLSYDALVLATGADAFIPPIPGVMADNHFSLKTIPDMDNIHEYIERKKATRALVIGGGYIGIEAAEQLKHRGLTVTIIESGPHILAPFDGEMVTSVQKELESHGVSLVLGERVVRFEGTGDTTCAITDKDNKFVADFAILALGVRPNTALARAAGLAIGERGGITVDASLRTSDPHIWAGGDVVETEHVITGEREIIALAGPANRQGRIIADSICGRPSTYKGSLGTAIIRVFNLTAACTGKNERALRSKKQEYQKVYLHPTQHASYYPGASRMNIKLLFNPSDGRILGAQAVGQDGVDKRIDILATAIAGGLTVEQLTELELCYAPPYGSAKDAINIAGMVAENVRKGDVPTVHWHAVKDFNREQYQVLDVRDMAEREKGHIEHSLHIPVTELRSRLSELDLNKQIVCYCASGQRSAVACRTLLQHGFRAYNLSGAFMTYQSAIKEKETLQ
jgi:NADPH-dependent 2,4-dienoyl-CoA reductase/sulfur reductase-like enzyme